ncbi:MAG: hypothetical protein ACRDZY_05400, partial [Acidimicrobiales bacterium]
MSSQDRPSRARRGAGSGRGDKGRLARAWGRPGGGDGPVGRARTRTGRRKAARRDGRSRRTRRELRDVVRLRLGLVGLVVAALFAAMFARLYYLQVLSSHQYTHLAAQNQTRQVADPAPRGLILDRGGKPLVADQTTEVITLARQAATNHPKVVGRLAQVLHMSSAQVKAQLSNNQYSPYRPVPIKSGVPATTVVYLAEHEAQFPGVSSQLEAQRSYPYGPTAAQLLGYTGAISATELKKLRSKGYRAGDQVGKSGVEASFERWLHGQPGMTKLSVDAKGTVVGTVSHKAPVPGDNVQLSLDLGLQKTAGKALANEIHSLQGKVIPGTGGLTAQAPAGAAVVLNPENGAILASASYPTYN